MTDMKKLMNIMNETTVSGSIAAGPAVGLGTQRRVQEEDSDDGTKAPDAPKAKEFGLWKNSVLAGAEQRDKKKSKKVAESLDEERGKMSSFRQNIISQQEQVMKNISRDSSLDDAQREYLMMINDPKGTVFRASYSSFPKGQAAREQVLDQISKKYNIHPKHLEQADETHMMKSLNERDVIESKSKDRNEMDTPAVQSGLKKMAARHKDEKWSTEKLTDLGKRLASVKTKSKNLNELEYGVGQRQLKLAEENISEEQLLAKEFARKLDLFMKGLDHQLSKKSSDRDLIKKTEPSTGAMRENEKRIGPDENDPYEKGWRAGFRHTDSNPYPTGSKEATEWDNGYAEAESQPNHYDESVEEGKTGPGLWANIHAKRERIKKGSGERMRKPGSKGAPTADNLKAAGKTEGVEETTGDPKFDKMLKDMTGKKVVAKQQKADTKQQSRDAFSSMFGGGNPADTLGIRKKGVSEDSDPCWDNYKQVGMKKKNGKKVPNCVPKEGVSEDTSSVKYGVFSNGGSVGDQKWKNDPIKTFDNKEEAIAFAKHRRAGLSKGEKAYYRMSYVVKPIKNTTEKQVNEHGDPWEDPNYDPRGGGETRSSEQIAKDNAEHAILSKKLGLKNTNKLPDIKDDMLKMMNHFMGQHSKKKGVSEGSNDIRSARVGDEIILKNQNYGGVIVKVDGSDISFKNKSDNKRYKATINMIDRNLSQENRYKEKSDTQNKKFDDAMASDMERINKSGALKKFGIGMTEQTTIKNMRRNNVKR